MRVILDTNVVVDVLADRVPFVEDSAAVLNMAAVGRIEAAITANSVTDIAYLIRKHIEPGELQVVLKGLLELLDVVAVNYENCVGAFDLQMPDYEDAVLAHCAKCWQSDFIITRNTKDFINSPVPALTPTAFINKLIPEQD